MTNEKIEKILDNRNDYLGIDENRALCFEDYVVLTNETYDDIQDKLRLLDIVKKHLKVHYCDGKPTCIMAVNNGYMPYTKSNNSKEIKKIIDWLGR